MTSSPIDPDRFGPTTPLHRRPFALAAVFGGGLVGTAARYAGESWLPTTGTHWPWATFTINLLGAFLLGLLLESLLRSGEDVGIRRRIRLAAGTGFCGAFTTYSTFALETAALVRAGAPTTAAAYAVISVLAGVAFAWAGIGVGSTIVGRQS
ncbi:fluoride efflux transporter FluC [Actinomycetes bacterium M1A6_2h]